MAFCLVKEKADKFLEAIKNGDLDIDKLVGMTSKARVTEFMKKIGINEVIAKEVNALFESKLLLKYQKRGMINWIEKTAGLKKNVKRDLLSRVQRMEEVLSPDNMFLEDLAAKRLGIGVSQEEAETIFNLSKKVEELGKKFDTKTQSWSSETSRLEYGLSLVNFKNYVGDLKISAEAKGWKDYIQKPQEILYELSGAAKSMLATLDNSFYGRQGIKTLYTQPVIWGKDFIKSWKDITRTLVGKGFKRLDDPLDLIKADVWSRPNAMNGRYGKMKLDIGLETEEAFPSSLPERIPVLGRVFQASETAFNGGAMRMRADLADKYLQIAKRHRVDIDNIDELKGIGSLTNATTGRGKLGVLEPAAKQINALMFSVKFLKSNFDTLTLHLFDPSASKFVKQQAAKNLLSIIGGIAGILMTANAINDESVDFDPRSSNFGKIKIGDTRIDVSGGMSSLVTLASRLVPTKHNGEWGLWFKSSTTGKFKDLTEGKYGQMTALDIFDNFWQGKLSPTAGLVRDIWKGQNYDREKVTIQNAIKNLTIPISAQQFQDLMDSGEEGEKILLFMILEGLGFGATTYK